MFTGVKIYSHCVIIYYIIIDSHRITIVLNCSEAFNIVVVFWIFCGALLLLTMFTVIRDEDIVQNKVIEQLES
jgi:hypothetical protein